MSQEHSTDHQNLPHNVNRSMFLDTCDSFHTQIINQLLEPVTATLTSVTLLLQN